MTDGDDASLDDFRGGEGSVDSEDAAEVDPDSVTETATDAVDPATATYAWSAAPVACAACGETVRRRWRGEAGLVCRECKKW